MRSRFDRTAEAYARHSAERDWADVVAWCAPVPDDRALDVAAGSGGLSAALLAAGVGEAVALDPSTALLAYAAPGVVRVEGRAERLPFEDDAFTLVTCVHGLHHVAGPARAVEEMVRVLAPGGRLVVEDYLADPDPRAAGRWERIERTRDPEHGRLLREGEVRSLVGEALDLEAEETWIEAFAVGPWLEVAGCVGDAAARIRAEIGGGEARLRAWRARFAAPAGSAA
jgi:ubiquinone/menaquinone biosynthesis C-methylase UbiE